MKILFAVICAVPVMVLISCCLLAATRMMKLKDHKDNGFLKGLNGWDWLRALAIGSMAGLACFLGFFDLWPLACLVVLVVLIAMLIYIVYWYYQRNDRIQNIWPSIGVVVIMFFIMMALCAKIAESVPFGTLVMAVPWVVSVSVVGLLYFFCLTCEAEEAKKKGKESHSGTIAKVVMVVMVLTVVATLLTACVPTMKAFLKNENSSEEEVEIGEPEEEPPTAVDEMRDSRFTQEWVKNEKNRINSEFSKELAKKAKDEDGEITPDIVKETVLEDCGHDARLLAIWANALDLWDDPNNYEDLLTSDKKYLSELGISLYNEVKGYLEAMTITREEAPEDGVNTGYDGGYVVAPSAGITGDRTGTSFTSYDGEDKFWLMDRCGNFVYRGKVPKVPTGKTDEPKKTKKGKGDNSRPRYTKNPKKMKGRHSGKNDDKGPGEKTIDPNDKNKSTKDTSKGKNGSSSSKDYSSPKEYNNNNSESDKNTGGGNNQQEGSTDDKAKEQPKDTVKDDKPNEGVVPKPE